MTSHDDKPGVNFFDRSTIAIRTGAWCLLSAICSWLASNDNSTTKPSSFKASSPLIQAVRASHIYSSFLTLSLKKLRALTKFPGVPSDKKRGFSGTPQDCLMVLAKMGSFVPFSNADGFFSELGNDLETFTVSIYLIPAVVHAFIALSKRMCDDDDQDSENNNVFDHVRVWVNGLVRSDYCVKVLCVYLASWFFWIISNKELTRISVLPSTLSTENKNSGQVSTVHGSLLTVRWGETFCHGQQLQQST